MPKRATKSVRWFVKSCLADKGDQEHPLGSNHTKYGEKFGWDNVAWCVEYAWCKYEAAGVHLPVKTASCVVLYDTSEKAGLRYDSDHARPGDVVIRTWQHLGRHARGFNPAQTHCQEVLEVKRMGRTIRHPAGSKYLGLWGGNQGAGYVGPAIEWVPAGDASILGALAFHRLFTNGSHTPPTPHDPKRDEKTMPAAKSHKHPKVGKPARRDAVALTRRLHGKEIRDHRKVWRRLRDRIDRKLRHRK